MRSDALRQAFLDFFADKGHTIVPSASLIPAHDPTLLFTNAGMVPFKAVFLGQEARPYSQAVSAQRCVRAGGKHNDLQMVGVTARHHTFFEMLGNFSFGAYFKREAIAYAWEFLTSTLQLPPERLWVTVYTDDADTEAIWLQEMGVSAERFSRCGAADNFWSMGETGPCGPCTEIFYDHGPAVAGGPPGSPEQDGDRYVEIWNLVFMQFNRDHSGQLTPLPTPAVDTGMGLERISAVMQGVHDNYATDLFAPLRQAIAEQAGVAEHVGLRVMADHIRASSFLMLDGVVPSNEGRGYVLRRIIRRALRFAHQLRMPLTVFAEMVEPLQQIMAAAHPDLRVKSESIRAGLVREAEQFGHTLAQGLQLLQEALQPLAPGDILPGDVAFKLYDTYGFPVDLTTDIVIEAGMQVDSNGFERCMTVQRQQSKAAAQFDWQTHCALPQATDTVFLGYDDFQAETRVKGIYVDGQPVTTLSAPAKAVVVLTQTPFYAEAGGQVGDTGAITANGVRFEVKDTLKQGHTILHHGELVIGSLQLDLSMFAEIDVVRREAIRRHHSATHLVHAALRQILGEHVQQKGSLVNAEKLRFDFSHPQPITTAELHNIQREVNIQIRTNHLVETELMTQQAARDAGAIALFGKKYAEQVRVLRMGDFSLELCGGTHVARTGDIGYFRLTLETSVAAGIRRVEAVAGFAAEQVADDVNAQLHAVAQQLKTDPTRLSARLEQLLTHQCELEKQLSKYSDQLQSHQVARLLQCGIFIDNMRVVAEQVQADSMKSLLTMLDKLKAGASHAVFVLAAVHNDKVLLVAGISADCTAHWHAGKLVKHVAEQLGGKGGGRADVAQGGGNYPERLPSALGSVKDWVHAAAKSD